MTPAAQSHANTVNALAARGLDALASADFTGTVCHTSRHSMGIQVAILVLAGACAVAASAVFFPFTVDDAFIVARYAVNARDLGEWTFNAGEHVSAMTSPLHGLVLLGLSLFVADPIPAYKGVAVLVVAIAFSISLVHFGLFRREALPVVAVLVGPSIILWMFAGLETPLLLAIVTTMAAFDGSAQLKLRPTPHTSLLGGLAAAAVLTRYDAVLFAGPVFLAALMRTHSWRVRMTAVAVAGLPVVAWLIYSWQRFDSILPTSFYIKTPSGAADVIFTNVRYMAVHLAITGIALMAAYALVRVLTSGRARATLIEEFRMRWGLHVGLMTVLAYGATMATVHMMFAFRHFVPYLGAAALALAHPARRAGQGLPTPALPWADAATAVVILLVHAFHAEALYHRSLQGLGTSGEYAAEGTAGYTRDFIPAMRRNATDTRAHWQRVNKGRPPRVWTFAAGALPHAYRDAYIFEELVSFRHYCPQREKSERPDSREWRAHADYIHAFTRHGRLNRLLAPVRPRDVQLISEQSLHFNGQDEKLLVFYNAAPMPNILPPRIDEPCLTALPQE
jgi:arabinofuranosyltransferase